MRSGARPRLSWELTVLCVYVCLSHLLPAEVISHSSRPFWFHVSSPCMEEQATRRSQGGSEVKELESLGAIIMTAEFWFCLLCLVKPFEGRGNLLPKEGPINISLHVKLRGAGYITLAVLMGAAGSYIGCMYVCMYEWSEYQMSCGALPDISGQ